MVCAINIIVGTFLRCITKYIFIHLLFTPRSHELTMTLCGDQDLQVLSQVKKTASRSKKLMGDLQHLKGKIYYLENYVPRQMYPAKVRPVLWARSRWAVPATPVRWQSSRFAETKWISVM